MAGGRASTRERGSVRQRGNSFEIKVYSGVDPVTGKDVYLYGNTKDEREVEKIRDGAACPGRQATERLDTRDAGVHHR
jgi:hypothetical protein